MHSPSQADEAARSALQFEKMTKTPVPKLILGLAAPTILSMLITSIYNLADTFFVGQLSTSASGAVGVVSSLMAIIQALGFMLGHGAGGIISRSLGNQDTHAATKFASTSFFTALVFGIVLAGVGLSTLPGFMMLLGSTDTILPHACAYARPILIAAPLMMSSLVMNNILRYEGKASFAMIGLVTGGVLNILLDPIFIFGFGMGTGGATVACAKAGASVCHVDAAKGMVAWAKENARCSGLAEAPIRWIVDDCAKFVEREIRRGKTYDAIIMDPPSYGRGPGGEVWKLEENLYPFVKLCARVLSDQPLFVILNSYTTGLAPSVLGYILQLLVGKKFGGRVTWDELGLPCTDSGMALPCGATGRWMCR